VILKTFGAVTVIRAADSTMMPKLARGQRPLQANTPVTPVSVSAWESGSVSGALLSQ
jgi:hypothetical protein